MAPSSFREGTPLMSEMRQPSAGTPLKSEMRQSSATIDVDRASLHSGPASGWSSEREGGLLGDASERAAADWPPRRRRRSRGLAAPATAALLATVALAALSRRSREGSLPLLQQPLRPRADAAAAVLLATGAAAVADDDAADRIFYFTAGEMMDNACLYRDREGSAAQKSNVEVFAKGSGSVEDCAIDEAGIVYFTDKRQGVLKVSSDGGTTSSLATLNTTGEPKGMARCDALDLVLWASGDGSVYRTRTSRSRAQGRRPTPVERLLTNLSAPFDVAVAPTLGRLFVSDPGAGAILASDLDGGGLSTWAQVEDVHGIEVRRR